MYTQLRKRMHVKCLKQRLRIRRKTEVIKNVKRTNKLLNIDHQLTPQVLQKTRGGKKMNQMLAKALSLLIEIKLYWTKDKKRTSINKNLG